MQRRTSFGGFNDGRFQSDPCRHLCTGVGTRGGKTTPQAELYCADISDFTFVTSHTVTALGDVMCYQIKDGRHALKNNIVLNRIYRTLAPGSFV